MTDRDPGMPPLRETATGSWSPRVIWKHLFIPGPDPSHIGWILTGLTLLGLTLRLLDINKYIAYDEAYTFIHFASRPLKHILADYSAPNNHILHTLLMGIAYRLLGGEAWALRLPAFTAGILAIPVMYLAGRRFFSPYQSLAAAGLMAVIPLFVSYSVNGRGYTLLVLLALLLTNFAAIIVTSGHRIGAETRAALAAFAITAALGFYTIPIFLYPMAGISLWVVFSLLFSPHPAPERVRRLTYFLAACLAGGLLTFVLYSPVIFFGSGLSALIGNEIVRSLSWSTFMENLDPRLLRAWNKWMIGINPVIEYLFMGGFLLSLLFYRRVTAQNMRLPLQIFLILAVAFLLVLQRVSPLPRIWIYLEAFYLMFAAAGLVWLADLFLRGITGPSARERILATGIALVFLAAWTGILLTRLRNPVFQDRDRLPEAYAAEYVAGHLQPDDTLIATGPVDIQTAYYLKLLGVSFDRFYKRDHPVQIRNALVLLRTNSKHDTPERVLAFFKLDQALDVDAAELVFQYASVEIYSIPAR